MDHKSLTDSIIDRLLLEPKLIKTRRAKDTIKAKHMERNYDVSSADGSNSYTLIFRQSTVIPENFSCGLIWHANPSNRVILTRYNGPGHPHSNPIEDEQFELSCHIHRATERYVSIGRKAEHYAVKTDKYKNANDALICLMRDCNIAGFNISEENEKSQTSLF